MILKDRNVVVGASTDKVVVVVLSVSASRLLTRCCDTRVCFVLRAFFNAAMAFFMVCGSDDDPGDEEGTAFECYSGALKFLEETWLYSRSMVTSMLKNTTSGVQAKQELCMTSDNSASAVLMHVQAPNGLTIQRENTSTNEVSNKATANKETHTSTNEVSNKATANKETHTTSQLSNFETPATRLAPLITSSIKAHKASIQWYIYVQDTSIFIGDTDLQPSAGRALGPYTATQVKDHDRKWVYRRERSLVLPRERASSNPQDLEAFFCLGPRAFPRHDRDGRRRRFPARGPSKGHRRSD